MIEGSDIAEVRANQAHVTNLQINHSAYVPGKCYTHKTVNACWNPETKTGHKMLCADCYRPAKTPEEKKAEQDKIQADLDAASKANGPGAKPRAAKLSDAERSALVEKINVKRAALKAAAIALNGGAMTEAFKLQAASLQFDENALERNDRPGPGRKADPMKQAARELTAEERAARKEARAKEKARSEAADEAIKLAAMSNKDKECIPALVLFAGRSIAECIGEAKTLAKELLPAGRINFWRLNRIDYLPSRSRRERGKFNPLGSIPFNDLESVELDERPFKLWTALDPNHVGKIESATEGGKDSYFWSPNTPLDRVDPSKWNEFLSRRE